MRKYYTQQSQATRPVTSLIESENSHWDLLYAFASGHVDVLGVEMLSRIESICTTRNGAAYLRLSSEFDSQLQSYNVNDNPEEIFVHRQIACLLKKFPFSKLELDSDPKAAAIIKWRQAEDQCKITNERLRSTLPGELPSFVAQAQLLIEECLGDLTPSVVMKMISEGTHGPGATRTSQGNRTTPYYKYADFPYSVTRDASSYALAAISANPRWMEILENSGRRTDIPSVGAPQFQKEIQIFRNCVEVVDSDKITFVPKDARTERPIAISASLNMYLQLGVSHTLMKKLAKVGVNLYDQTRNRELAYQGSRYFQVAGVDNPNQFSTIDLASASDTISLEIVKLLLPADWYALLMDLRHETGILGEELLKYQKFSAMGNGYTFALESLIFWAVAKAAIQVSGQECTHRDISVFGDDIIVRRHSSQLAVDALIWSGFLINSEKSFLTGPFKESCGADFFKGTNVRPFYLKRRIVTYEDIYFCANSFSRLCIARKLRRGLVQGFTSLLRHIPCAHITHIPMNDTSDSGLCSPLDQLTQLGIRPWLTPSEIRHLVKSKYLRKEDIEIQSSYTWQQTIKARHYSGAQRIRLMLSLDQGSDGSTFFLSKEKLIHKEASSSGIVTRRNAVQRVCRVVPVLNWNGNYTRYQVHCHPFYWK